VSSQRCRGYVQHVVPPRRPYDPSAATVFACIGVFIALQLPTIVYAVLSNNEKTPNDPGGPDMGVGFAGLVTIPLGVLAVLWVVRRARRRHETTTREQEQRRA
jgi:Na+/melibiose symporter-like transporter